MPFPSGALGCGSEPLIWSYFISRLELTVNEWPQHRISLKPAPPSMIMTRRPQESGYSFFSSSIDRRRQLAAFSAF